MPWEERCVERRRTGTAMVEFSTAHVTGDVIIADLVRKWHAKRNRMRRLRRYQEGAMWETEARGERIASKMICQPADRMEYAVRSTQPKRVVQSTDAGPIVFPFDEQPPFGGY